MTTIKRGLVRNKEASRQAVFLALLKQAGLPHPHREYRFDETRRWRFDYAWPEHGVAVEQNGGVWIQGRHTRGAGQIKDMEKMNAAQLANWRVFQFTPQQLCADETISLLKEAIWAGQK